MLQAEIQPCAEEVVQDSYTSKVQLKHCFQTGNKQANTESIMTLKGTPVRKKTTLGNSLMKDFTPRVWV